MINRSDILAALRERKDQGASTEEIGDAIGVPNEANARRRLYHSLCRMVEIEAMGGREDPSGDLRLISVARNARLSYLTHDGKPPLVMQDLDLARRLIGSVPLHASPAEHQARPDRWVNLPGYNGWEYPQSHGNFRGWIQNRKLLPGECQ